MHSPELGLDVGSCSGQFAVTTLLLLLLKAERPSDMESLGSLEQECPMDLTAFRVSVLCERGYVTHSLPERCIVDVPSFIHHGHIWKRMGTQGDVSDLGGHVGV
jgi:hypothetical protein